MMGFRIFRNRISVRHMVKIQDEKGPHSEKRAYTHRTTLPPVGL